MYKSAFANFSDAYLVALGFILFMSVFLGALVWTIIIQKKSFYEKLSHLPIYDGDKNER